MVSKKSTKVGTTKWTGMKKSGASAKPATKKRTNKIGADSKSTRVPLFSGYERVIKKSKRPIELVQETKYQGNDWWEWAVWVEAKPADMAKINYVEYTLHPTFPNPLRKQTNRDEKFRVGSAGWGEFMIAAEIVNQDRSRIKTHHWLTLEYPDKSPIPSGKFSVLASKKESERPGIFLSGGVTDLGLGSALTDALQHQGFEVLRMDNAPPDLPWDRAIDVQIKKSDLMVVLVSGDLTTWSKREIDSAVSHKIPILPIVIGSQSLPYELEDYQAIPLKEVSNPVKIAPNLAQQVVQSLKH